ncbi:hypothetical protein J7L67_08565, partial [bacterium]|nr:hypothetical protein [bacterium]
IFILSFNPHYNKFNTLFYMILFRNTPTLGSKAKLIVSEAVGAAGEPDVVKLSTVKTVVCDTVSALNVKLSLPSEPGIISCSGVPGFASAFNQVGNPRP